MMSDPGFTGGGLDRADRLRADAEALARLAASDEARLLRLAGLDPVLDESGSLSFTHPEAIDPGAELLFLGLDGASAWFAPLTRLERGAAGDPRALWRVIDAMAPGEAALWGTARSLVQWHNKHLFCGACGSETSLFRGGWGRRCPNCRAEHFPRVDPVVIMLAEHDGKVLVGRQPGFPAGRYSALAGFVEPGESIEQAVARELAEEAGVAAGAVRYVASQPWPFPGSLMIACIARAGSDSLDLDGDELEHAMWVDRAGVAAALAGEAEAPFLAPPRFAIAHTLLARWLAGA
jgi:NAD+ diphosphatase